MRSLQPQTCSSPRHSCLRSSLTRNGPHAHSHCLFVPTSVSHSIRARKLHHIHLSPLSSHPSTVHTRPRFRPQQSAVSLAGRHPAARHREILAQRSSTSLPDGLTLGIQHKKSTRHSSSSCRGRCRASFYHLIVSVRRFLASHGLHYSALRGVFEVYLSRRQKPQSHD